MDKYVLEESAKNAKKARDDLELIKFGFRLKKTLSCNQYIIFFLKIEKNLSFSQIADIMGLSKETARTHWKRAVAKCRKLSNNL